LPHRFLLDPGSYLDGQDPFDGDEVALPREARIDILKSLGGPSSYLARAADYSRRRCHHRRHVAEVYCPHG